MSLPQFNTSDRILSQMQSAWATQINPMLDNPANQGVILKNQSLVVGSNVINHKLGRKLQGWIIVRKRQDANIHDNQDSNQSPNLTLNLTSDAVCSVDLMVF